MQWTDEGIVLGARRHGETSVILELMTRDRGRHLGLVRGGAGTALVGLILIAANWAFFWTIHLDYAFLTAVVSGLCNLVPYLGAVLSWVPPFVIGLPQWKTAGPFFGVAAVLSAFHLIGANVLMPAIVGRRVHLNALAVTIALLFWGWIWGGAGLLLAIPITATMKVICDHVPTWRRVGRWLGA